MNSSELRDAGMAIVRTLPFFDALKDESIERLLESAVRKEFLAEEIVIFEDDPPSGFYVVEMGWLKSTKLSLDGQEQILDIFGPKQMLNAINIFSDNLRIATVTALEPSVLWFFPGNTLLSVMKGNPDIANSIIRMMVNRIQFLVNKVEDMALRTVDSRLANYLVTHHQDELIERRRWATQAYMAAQIGTTTDVINRHFRNFEQEGLIQISRRQIKLIDLPKLKILASS
jgi:CRP-like cAMP-binding protein